MGQGTDGKIEVFEHFLGFHADTYLDTLQPIGTNGINSYGVGATTFAATVTEPGGVLAVTTDTTDNNNWVAWAGPFKPSDGGVWMEARMKVDAIDDCALFVGWSETLDATTPVMPAEFATESFVYSSTGSILGLQFDKDATTADWRACATDDQSYAIDCDSDTTRAHNPPVAAKWDVVRVEVEPNGNGEVWLADDTGALNSVKRFTTTPVSPTAYGYMIVMVENRADAAAVLSLDYINAGGYIDWTQ